MYTFSARRLLKEFFRQTGKIGKEEHSTTFCESYKQSVRQNALLCVAVRFAGYNVHIDIPHFTVIHQGVVPVGQKIKLRNCVNRILNIVNSLYRRQGALQIFLYKCTATPHHPFKRVKTCSSCKFCQGSVSTK